MGEALAAFCQGVFLGLVVVVAILTALVMASVDGTPGINIHRHFDILIIMPDGEEMEKEAPDLLDRYLPPPAPTATPGVRDNGAIPGFKDPHSFKEKLDYQAGVGRIG